MSMASRTASRYYFFMTDTSFVIEEKIYPLESVQNAVYTFTDRAYVKIEQEGPGKLKVSMSFKEGTAPSVCAAVKGEFDNELIFQVLRQRISASNQKIREFIVTKALVSAQPSALVAAAAPAAAPSEGSCAECAAAPAKTAAPTQVDEALEKEIDLLLAEIEGSSAGSDPLGVSVAWEDKFGPKGEGKEKKSKKTKTASRAKNS